MQGFFEICVDLISEVTHLFVNLVQRSLHMNYTGVSIIYSGRITLYCCQCESSQCKIIRMQERFVSCAC